MVVVVVVVGGADSKQDGMPAKPVTTFVCADDDLFGVFFLLLFDFRGSLE